MSKIAAAARQIEKIDELAGGDGFVNRIHPLIKLIITILFLVLTVSFKGGELTGLLSMALYPFFMFELTGLSFKDALKRMKIVLPLVCAVGILNPFFDRVPVMNLFGMTVTSGMLSMLSLMLKGILTVLASYLLIATTRLEDICCAMRMLHVPGIIVTEFMLIFRYISVLLRETDRMIQSYELRAPGQKGVAFKAWGPLAGHLLLRSMDRAGEVYESMCLRGYSTEFLFSRGKKLVRKDLIFGFAIGAALIFLRVVPLFELIGRLV